LSAIAGAAAATARTSSSTTTTSSSSTTTRTASGSAPIGDMAASPGYARTTRTGAVRTAFTAVPAPAAAAAAAAAVGARHPMVLDFGTPEHRPPMVPARRAEAARGRQDLGELRGRALLGRHEVARVIGIVHVGYESDRTFSSARRVPMDLCEERVAPDFGKGTRAEPLGRHRLEEPTEQRDGVRRQVLLLLGPPDCICMRVVEHVLKDLLHGVARKRRVARQQFKRDAAEGPPVD
jgi:hypothetical protein